MPLHLDRLILHMLITAKQVVTGAKVYVGCRNPSTYPASHCLQACHLNSLQSKYVTDCLQASHLSSLQSKYVPVAVLLQLVRRVLPTFQMTVPVKVGAGSPGGREPPPGPCLSMSASKLSSPSQPRRSGRAGLLTGAKISTLLSPSWPSMRSTSLW